MRTWRRSLVGLTAVVTAGALLAGACGGGDDDTDDTRRDDASESEPESDDGAGSGSDAADTTTTAAGGAADVCAAGESTGAPEADEIAAMSFCDGFRAALRADSATALAGAGQLDPPEAIAEDWQVFMDFAETSMSGEAPAGSPEEVQAAGEAAQAATQNVLDYVGRECGYSVDAATGEVNDDDG